MLVVVWVHVAGRFRRARGIDDLRALIDPVHDGDSAGMSRLLSHRCLIQLCCHRDHALPFVPQLLFAIAVPVVCAHGRARKCV